MEELALKIFTSVVFEGGPWSRETMMDGPVPRLEDVGAPGVQEGIPSGPILGGGSGEGRPECK